jgi:hypothetical protein
MGSALAVRSKEKLKCRDQRVDERYQQSVGLIGDRITAFCYLSAYCLDFWEQCNGLSLEAQVWLSFLRAFQRHIGAQGVCFLFFPFFTYCNIYGHVFSVFAGALLAISCHIILNTLL